MSPVIVADAGPLIALAKCGQLHLLALLFSQVHIPRSVLQETVCDPRRADAQAISAFAEQFATVHEDRDDALFQQVSALLDAGEAQAISLASALGCGVLMDERRGRAVAAQHHIVVFGVLGVLLQAKRMGHLPLVAPVINQLLASDYRISSAVVTAALAKAAEMS